MKYRFFSNRLWLLSVLFFSVQVGAQDIPKTEVFLIELDPAYIEPMQGIFPATDAKLLSEAYGLKVFVSENATSSSIMLQDVHTLETTKTVSLDSFRYESFEIIDETPFYTWFTINGVSIGARYLPSQFDLRMR